MPELVCAADDPRWAGERRRGVTATDIVTILGLSSRDSPYSLYWRKRGEIPEPADTDRWRLGRHLEPYVAERWAEAMLTADQEIHPEGLYRHSSRTWQMATVDREIVEYHSSNRIAVLECKSWADADRHAWDGAPPPAVRAQVLWQIDVMGVSTGHVAVVFLPSGEFRSCVIDHDSRGTHPASHQLCNDCADLELMRAAGEEFMARLRGELPPPDVDGSAATLAAVRARFPARVKGKAVSVDRELWDSYAGWKKDRDYAETMMREYEARIREEIGEATEIEADGQVVGRRVIAHQQVKAHVRHMDYIRR